MKKTVIILILNVFIFLIPLKINAQNIDSLQSINDSTLITKKFNHRDTLKIDTLNNILKDTILISKSDTNKKAITNPIDFEARDSMYISVKEKQIILFGVGKLNTEGMDLMADSIGINMTKKELMAAGLRDSLGKKEGIPIFKNEGKDYTATKLRYNFDSKNGLVYDVMTAESDGYLHGELVKIHNNDEMHILNGKYTTCNHPHPHYYIDLTKAKLKANDKIITGPLYFVIMDIPLPIAAPFGFFPLSKKNTSGIHLPTYADELDRGFGLIGAGYFWAINDYIDIDITGDIYSKGSWGLKLNSNLKKKYLLSSLVNLSFFHYRNGEKRLPTTKINNSYNIQVAYNQDQKAMPNSNLSANINFVWGNIQKYNATTIDQYVNTTSNSNISYQKTFQGTPFRMAATMNLSQNLSDSTLNLKFPNVTFSMNKIFIFKSATKPAKGKWYEKIGLSFTSSLINTLDTHDTILFRHIDQVPKLMKSGFKYDVPLQTSFTLLKYFNISPSFNFSGRIYPNKIVRNIAGLPDTSYIREDTIWGFNHVYNFNTSINMSTRIYGMFNLNIGSLKAIRHTISPSISYTLVPDFSDQKWGYYAQDPLDTSKTYTYYANGVFGVPGKGQQQIISFNVGNNFEAKVLQKNDSTSTEKKIKLLDNLSFGSSYNFNADSLKMSNISMNGSMSPIQNTQISFSSIFDPYVMNNNGVRINKYELMENKKLARLTSAQLSIGTKISSKDLQKMSSSNKDGSNKGSENESNAPNEPNSSNSTNSTNSGSSGNFDWSASISYTFRFSKSYNISKQEFDINLTQNATLILAVSPTPLWTVGIRTGYDFDVNKITSTTINFTRDLHCWEMNLQLTPFGLMKSYLFNIKIKASMFEAIKFKKERSWHDNSLGN